MELPEFVLDKQQPEAIPQGSCLQHINSSHSADHSKELLQSATEAGENLYLNIFFIFRYRQTSVKMISIKTNSI